MFLYFMFVNFMVQFSTNYVLLGLLLVVTFPFVIIKFFSCPKCKWPVLQSKTKNYAGWNDECQNCGLSFLEPFDTDINSTLK